jgi:uncharacterized protein
VAARLISLPEHLSGLLEPASYPHPVRGVELLQTPISWVLLTGDYAYKIKRPVCYPFLDMRDGQRRLELCREELRLNRRFTTALYLDVCPIVQRDSKARMGGTGEVLEHAVRMRQFPRTEELDRLLEAGRSEAGELRDFGGALAGIHATLPRAMEGARWGDPAAVCAAITSNLDQTGALGADRFGTHRVALLRPAILAGLAALTPWMGARRAAGFVRECHGDLHCGNVVRWDGALHAFDCLEFDPALRWIDPAQEIAFLLADLTARNAAAHAHAFISGYLAHSGDYGACRGIALYMAHCALVRAKVMALAADERAAARIGFPEFADAAEQSLAPRHPVLVVMMGLSGSGKSVLAAQLAPLLGAIHLQSDLERKRLAGMAPGQRSDSGVAADLYAPQLTDGVYAHLARSAQEMLAGGWSVIVDATFATRARRAMLADVAARCGAPLRVLACHAPVEVLRERVTRRAAAGADASEADVPVLEWQLRHAEALRADEGLPVVDVDTSEQFTADALAALVRRCG